MARLFLAKNCGARQKDMGQQVLAGRKGLIDLHSVSEAHLLHYLSKTLDLLILMGFLQFFQGFSIYCTTRRRVSARRRAARCVIVA